MMIIMMNNALMHDGYTKRKVCGVVLPSPALQPGVRRRHADTDARQRR